MGALRGLGIAVVVLVAACGGGKKTPEPTGGGGCTPMTCSSAGKTCGEIPDGCGGKLECGSCPSGQSCGGGGVPNVCGAVAGCTPTSCAAQGKNCGAVADGCGGTLQCGSCPGGQTCGGGGTPNVCGAAACTPTTCATQKKDCGGIPDGCGGTLDCGACPQGEICGGGGDANVCAAPPPQPQVKWAHVLSTPAPDLVDGVAVDAAGNRWVLSHTTDEAGTKSTLRLEKLGPDGKALWAAPREWTYDGFTAFALAVTPDGHLLVTAAGACFGSCPSGHLDLGGGTVTGATLAKLDGDGNFVWQRDLTGWNVAWVASDDQNDAFVMLANVTSRLVRFTWDGAQVYADDVSGYAGAVDPAGNAVHATPFTSGNHGTLEKRGPDGTVLWTKDVPGAGWVFRAATSAKGTILLLANRAADVSFGGSTVTEGALVLYVYEADGTPRWARGFEMLDFPQLAVDPTGRVAIAGGTFCGLATFAYDLANDFLWRRDLPSDGRCPAGVWANAAAYGTDHEPLVCGGFSGSVALGTTTYVSRGWDGFCVDFSP